MYYTFTKDVDTRDGSDLYVMRIKSRLSKDEFKTLSLELRHIGGMYSPYKKGFIFKKDYGNYLSNKYPNEYLSDSEIQDLKNISIKDFCEQNGIAVSGHGKWYSLKEHDSCVINNNSNNFYWNSRQKTGDIITFVEEYYGVDFKKACEILGAKNRSYIIKPYNPEIEYIEREKADTSALNKNLSEDKYMKNTFAYLIKTRMIDPEVVSEFVDKGYLRQDMHKNAIFKTFTDDDKQKDLIAVQKKGTGQKPYQYIDPNGENVGFRYPIKNKDTIYLFEAPIDLMSYYDMNRDVTGYLIAMGGLKQNVILNNITKDTKKICICVDNDQAGDKFCETIKALKKIDIRLKNIEIERIKPTLKDFNDDLKEKKRNLSENIVGNMLDEVKKTAVNILKDENKMKEYLDFASNFYNYSLNNIALIYSQKPDAQFVGSRKFFGYKHIKVDPEEIKNGISVFIPKTYKYFWDENNNPKSLSDATEKEKKLIEQGLIDVYSKTSFDVGKVYDITQTTCPKDKIPEFLRSESLETKGNIDTKTTLKNLTMNIQKQGYEVNFTNLSNENTRLGVKGYTDKKEKITVNMKMPDENKIKTLIHEYAHCILHNDNAITDDEKANKNIREIQAESVAYMTLKKHGLVSKIDSPLYIAGYMKEFHKKIDSDGNEKISAQILSAIHQTFKATNKLLSDSIALNPENEVKVTNTKKSKTVHKNFTFEHINKSFDKSTDTYTDTDKHIENTNVSLNMKR